MQKPLDNPKDTKQRIMGLSVGVPTSAFLFTSLIGFNAAQVASLVVYPFSKKKFRFLNKTVAASFWGMCVVVADKIYGTHIVMTGDDVPYGENAICIANHQQMTDIPYIFFLALAKGRLGDLKWMAKNIIKYVPGVGWGLLFLDTVFLDRDWASDEEHIRATFANLTQNDVPTWLISFPEGTRITPKKLEKSQQYAKSKKLPELKHLLLPRTKGFVASMVGLREHVRAVYDFTLGYEAGVPTLWQFIEGFTRVAHLHVRRYPIEELPTDHESLSSWIMDRYVEKDALLDEFYRTGHFPGPERTLPAGA
ncbi:MAG: acyltransferase [Deltaproteobacteria bacterium]|nr:acyltransferase [Deltaproteobacteria bacterium]